MPSFSVFRPRGATVALALVLAACDSPSGPSDGSGDRIPPTAVRIVEGPADPFSGARGVFRLGLTGSGGRAAAGVAVAFATTDGTVSPSETTTDDRGETAVAWTLADRDTLQTLSLRSGNWRGEVTVRSRPEVVELSVGVPGTLALGERVSATVQGRTPSSRVVPFTGSVVLEVRLEVRVHEELPVVGFIGRTVEARGPGEAEIVARAGSLVSEPVATSVRRGPIVTGLSPASMPASGGTLEIRGYDLDQVATVEVDGLPLVPAGRASRRVEVVLPDVSAACRGRASLPVVVPGAHTVGGPHRLRRVRDDEVDLGPGAWTRLDAGPGHCVGLPPIPQARYALAYFDARGIRSARESEEVREWLPLALGVRDRTAAADGSATDGPPARLSGPGAAAAADLVDVAHPPSTAVPDYYADRDRPWEVGDPVVIPDGDGGLLDGTIFQATPRLAFATLARNAHLDVAGRIQDLADLVQLVTRHADPVFASTFGDERPTTTAAAGQMLVVVADWGFPGFLASGTDPRLGEGAWIGIDPGILALPRNAPLYLGHRVLTHELAHAWQFRFVHRRCRDLGDCAFSAAWYPWAVEGGAELVTEHILMTAYGYSFAGNHVLEGQLHNAFGALFRLGPDLYHHLFGFGYGSASWLLRDFVHRNVALGQTVPEAFAAVSQGALQGWYGNHFGTGERPGLRATMAALRAGAWDPEEAALLGLLSLAADDRTANAELQSPWLRNLWDAYPAALELSLGSGARQDVVLPAGTFAWYQIDDPSGTGGVVRIDADQDGLAWAIVRLR